MKTYTTVFWVVEPCSLVRVNNQEHTTASIMEAVTPSETLMIAYQASSYNPEITI
jgi:hypothetical protein